MERIITQDGKSWIERDSGKRVPLRLTKRKLRLALIARGIMPAQIVDIIDTLPSPQREIAHVEWETADFYDRTHNLISYVGQKLGLSETDIDDVFIAGEGL